MIVYSKKFLATILLLSMPGLIILAAVGLPPCSPGNIVFLMAILCLGPGIALTLLVMWTQAYKVGLSIRGGNLVVSFGSLGKTIIPLASVRDVLLLHRIKPTLRLSGGALPGLYIGLYKAENLGTVNLVLTRLDNVLLLVLEDGSKIALSPDNPEHYLELIKEYKGRGLRGPIRTEYIDTKVTYIAIAAVILMIIASMYIYTLMPEKVPIHYGSDWQPDKWGSKKTYLFIVIVLSIMEFFIILLGYIGSRRVPGTGLLLVPVVFGLGLLFIALMLIPLSCL